MSKIKLLPIIVAKIHDDPWQNIPLCICCFKIGAEQRRVIDEFKQFGVFNRKTVDLLKKEIVNA